MKRKNSSKLIGHGVFLIAVALFVGSAVWHELIAAIKLMLGKS